MAGQTLDFRRFAVDAEELLPLAFSRLSLPDPGAPHSLGPQPLTVFNVCEMHKLRI